MVELTLVELTFPDARFTAEAEFNAPFAGRGSADSDDGGELDAEPDGGTAGPSPASVVALLAGLVAVALLLWLRRRSADD